MDLLFLKLVVTPLLLAIATLVIRRWGEAIGGFLVGLPLTSGPVSFFLAVEHGAVFAKQATAGSLTATAAQAIFCLCYCRLAAKGWVIGLGGACMVFALMSVILQWAELSHTVLFIIALMAMIVMLYSTPNNVVKNVKIKAVWWDLPARMAIMAGLVVSITVIAPYVGAGVSGVLAALPFMATILAIFAHRLMGPVAAQQVMRGMVAGLYGFAAFFYALSLTLTRFELAGSYLTAIACALGVQGIAFHQMRKREKS